MELGEGMCITKKKKKERLRGMEVWGGRLWYESRREKTRVGREPCGNNKEQ